MAKKSSTPKNDGAEAADQGEGWTSPPLRIRSARDGFWRAGVQHHRKAQTHPAGAFTLDQVELLESEPMLTVERLTDDEHAAAVEKAAASAAEA
jgi:hypothetical protein